MSLNDRMLALFKAHPNEWINGRTLAEVGGYAGWRNRLTDLRLIYGMTIKNRKRYVNVASGKITVSEYRYLPPVEPEQLPLIERDRIGA